MTTPISEDLPQATLDLNCPAILGMVRYTATRMAKLLDDPSSDDDFAQELLMHLFQKQDQFDPSRGSATSFARRLVENRSKDLLRAIFAERRGFTQTVEWPTCPETGELVEFIDERSVPTCDWFEFEQAIDDLIDPERSICRLHLRGHAISDIARMLNMSRSAVYRSLDYMAGYFEDRGLKDSLTIPGAPVQDAVLAC